VYIKYDKRKSINFFKSIILFLLGLGVLFYSFLLYDYLYPIDISASLNTSRVVKGKNNTWLYAKTNNEDKWRFRVDVKKLDKNFVQMLLNFEDKNFYSHYGVDILALFRATSQLIQNGRVVSGASTITMQVARLLKPKARTVGSKLIEILNAFQLEYHYSKDEILAIYLTLAPYGANVEGVVSASMRYFAKEPHSLTASQSALLVALPKSPEHNRPDKHLKNAIKARDRVLKMALKKGLINSYEYKESSAIVPSIKLNRYPRYAPHLSTKVLQISKKKEIQTTINVELQKQLEIWAKSKSYMLAKNTTLALLVVNNSTASIEAYLGSHNMFSKNVSGFVDMVQAVRSPGSTLKPFIYALGFQKHLIHPATNILDVESRFGDYMPHNFSYSYKGEVSIAYALQYSLNIPAVKVLQKVGVLEFVSSLERVTQKLQIPKNRATLPVALGGIGMSLWQLAELYTTLANGGKSKHLHYLLDIEKDKLNLYDYNSCKMVTSILREVPAPKGFINQNNHIAYKTGTSYGYRDSWAMAYSKEYTVALWVGKPNNATQLKLTGLNTAAPLAFEVFSLLNSIAPLKHWNWRVGGYSNAPKALKNFDNPNSYERKNRLKFIYPIKNSRYRSAGCENVLVKIKVTNGEMPYSWYIDNKAIDVKYKSTTLPFAYGGHTITIIDNNGDVISRDIWVDEPEC